MDTVGVGAHLRYVAMENPLTCTCMHAPDYFVGWIRDNTDWHYSNGPMVVMRDHCKHARRNMTELQDIIIIIIIRISHFSALAGKYSPILGCIINRIRLGGLMRNLGNFLQLNMCQELPLIIIIIIITIIWLVLYVLLCWLSNWHVLSSLYVNEHILYNSYYKN
jgi:hypothetical protein